LKLFFSVSVEIVCVFKLILLKCSFLQQGTGPEVPKFLRYEGQVRNRRLGKRDTSLLIKDIWQEKAAHDAEVRTVMHFLFIIPENKREAAREVESPAKVKIASTQRNRNVKRAKRWFVFFIATAVSEAVSKVHLYKSASFVPNKRAGSENAVKFSAAELSRLP